MAAEKKKVLLGVTGGIAAYKACEIVRGLQKAEVDVRVVMTENATKFVGPLTFEALTGHAVGVDEFGYPGDAIPHIHLAQDCDLFLIAPCTMNCAAKLACGLADDLLTSAALATTAPLLVAPAANRRSTISVPDGLLCTNKKPRALPSISTQLDTIRSYQEKGREEISSKSPVLP